MNESEHAVVIFGTRGSSEAYAIRDFLHRCGIRFQWIELGDDEQARSQAQVTGLNDNRLPICAFPDGKPDATSDGPANYGETWLVPAPFPI
jgi:hypothetical protein